MKNILLQICLLLFTTAFHLVSAQDIVQYKARAIDAKSKKELFVGIFKETRKGNELLQIETTYFMNNASKPAAYRKVNFRAGNQIAPEYVFENYQTGARELIKPNKDLVDVYFKKCDEQQAIKKTLKVPGNYVVDAGLMQNLLLNWKLLKSGKKLLFNIVVAQRQDYYEFMLYEKTPAHEKEQGLSRFYFVSSHWFIRQIVDPIVLVVDNKTKFLTRYEGTTNLSDSKGELFLKAIITYQML